MYASEVKCVTHAFRHFTCRRHASRTEGVLIVPQGTLNLKPQGVVEIPFVLYLFDNDNTKQDHRY